jgi:hypothetical protein
MKWRRDPYSNSNTLLPTMTLMRTTISRNGRWVAAFTFVLAAATIILAVATIVSTYFILGQWKAAVDAQADSREQLRAYVTFSGGVQITNDKEGKSINYIFAPQFRNWGATRTSKFSAWASLKYFPGDVPNNQDLTKPFDRIETQNTIIGANGVAQLLVSLSSDEAIQAKNGKGVVIIWGRGDWADIYNPNAVYHVNFCLTLKPISSDGDNHIVFQPILYKAECNTGQ